MVKSVRQKSKKSNASRKERDKSNEITTVRLSKDMIEKINQFAKREKKPNLML